MVAPEEGDRLISFDPGIRMAGVAEFEFNSGWRLARAGLIRNPVKRGHDLEAVYGIARAGSEWVSRNTRLFISHIVCEVPKVYPASQQKGDQNVTVVPLAMVSAVFAAMAGLSRSTLVQYYPSDWKGSGDADVCTERIKTILLNTGEIHRVEECPTSYLHNVYDGVGVGLKFAGRFEPRRVYPL